MNSNNKNPLDLKVKRFLDLTCPFCYSIRRHLRYAQCASAERQRAIAQLVSVLVWGAKGPGFESRLPEYCVKTPESSSSVFRRFFYKYSFS
jgi:hypothetical protein